MSFVKYISENKMTDQLGDDPMINEDQNYDDEDDDLEDVL